MNNIPDGWKEYRLEEIAEIYNGNSINKTVKAEKYTGLKEGYNFIGTKDVGFDGIVNYENGVKIPFGESKFKIAPADCVFVCSEGGSAGKKTAYITQKVCFGNKLFAIVPKTKDCSSKYIYYFTRSNNFFDQFKSLLAGIIGGVSNKNFGKINLPLPSISEQQHIVTKIEELFSKLDAGIESLKKAKKQLAVYRQAVLKESFEQKENWRCVKLSDIGAINLGRQRSPKNISKDYPTKYIRAANITETGIDVSDILEMEFTPKEREKYYLKKNDIILSEASGSASQVGKPAIWKNEIENCCFQNTVIRHRIARDNPEYVFWYYKYLYMSGYFSRKVGGVGINHLGANNFSDFEINIPVSMEEQSSIVSQIESRLSVCDQIERTVNESLEKADVLRQSILKKAFEGGL